jgi:four helix bundle protein
MATLDRAADLKARTKGYAIRIVRLYRSLSRSTDAQVLGKQLLRSGTSVAANYRAACRSRSKAEFISKMSIVLEEADESAFWLELMAETCTLPSERTEDLLKETNEWAAIFGASIKTAKGN